MLSDLASKGLRTVDYDSGRSIRLDSAVRQALMNGIRNTNQATQDYVGKKIGSDGIELSAHLNCAPDHEDYQGKQYSNAEFGILQNTLDRPIGMWNCRHLAKPIILSVSVAVYSSKELADMKQKNADGVEYNDKQYSLYEIAQKRNQIENDIKIQNDIVDFGKTMRDDEMVTIARIKLTKLHKAYREVNEVAEFTKRPEQLLRGKKELD